MEAPTTDRRTVLTRGVLTAAAAAAAVAVSGNGQARAATADPGAATPRGSRTDTDRAAGAAILASAQADYFLKIAGIDGESTDDKHKGEIDIESWSWGETNASGSRAAGAGAGKVQMQDFHFVMRTSKATPRLLLACATGEHIKDANLSIRKAGSGQQEYLKFTISDVLVSSFQTGGAGTDPTDQISLNFAKVEIEYKPQKADGSLDAPISTGWDLKTNKST